MSVGEAYFSDMAKYFGVFDAKEALVDGEVASLVKQTLAAQAPPRAS